MAATLASVAGRVSQTLVDTGNILWPAAAVTEGVRLALGEYNLAAAVDAAVPAVAAVTLSGLDGAGVTTLPEVHETVIVWGAAGYCAQARTIDRADSTQLGTDAAQLKAWADGRLREFKAMLGALFPRYLAAALGSTAGGAGSDPAKTAAEITLLAAQADLASSQAAHLDGQESRAAAAAAQAAQDRMDEAARRADIRAAANAAWGSWVDEGD